MERKTALSITARERLEQVKREGEGGTGYAAEKGRSREIADGTVVSHGRKRHKGRGRKFGRVKRMAQYIVQRKTTTVAATRTFSNFHL